MKINEKSYNDQMGAIEDHAGGVIRGTAREKEDRLGGPTESV